MVAQLSQHVVHTASKVESLEIEMKAESSVLAGRVEQLHGELATLRASAQASADVAAAAAAAVAEISRARAAGSADGGGRNLASEGGVRQFNPVWVPRAGVALVGGFGEDTPRPLVETAIRALLVACPCPAADVTAVWCPEKRWSNGRVQFRSEDTLMSWLSALRSLPPEARAVEVSGARRLLWASKEQSIGRRETNAQVSHAAKVVRRWLEGGSGFNPALLQVMYTAKAVWYGEVKICYAADRAKAKSPWIVCDTVSRIGLGAQQIRALQDEINDF